MPTPFDTPATVPQPTPFQNVMGALGVTWGKDQSVANQDAIRLDTERKEQRQAHVWGPLYKVAGEIANANQGWGSDKVMLEIVKSPEWLAASSTPGFDHANAGKNLLELVKATRPIQPEYQTVPQNSMLIATPGEGSPGGAQPFIAGQGQTRTEEYNKAGEKVGDYNQPGQVFPQGTGATQPMDLTPQNPAANPQAAPATSPQTGDGFKYEALDGGESDSPVVPYSHSVSESGPLQPVIEESAVQYGINPDAWASQLHKESTWKTNALGPVLKDGDRAYGPAQIKGSTWNKELAPELGFAPTDINDPTKNIIAGAYYMSKLLRHYKGDYTKAWMAYNWGQGNVDDWDGDWSKVPDETVEYVLDISNGGVNVPQGVSGRGPQVRTRRAIINELPDERPATVEEVNEFVADRKEFMFLGQGFGPWFKNLVTRSGRQLDPSLAEGDEMAWQQLDLTNRNNMAWFRYQLSLLNQPGDQRLAQLVDKVMQLAPDDVTQDPLASVTAAIDLYRNLSKEFHANEKINMRNSSSQQVKKAMADNERIMGVIRSLPPLKAMVDMQKEIRSGRLAEGPSTIGKQLGDFFQKGTGYALGDFNTSKPQPPSGRDSQPNKPSMIQTGGGQPAASTGKAAPQMNKTSTGVTWSRE